MTEELLVRHGAPTLAGLKTGSMFACPCSSPGVLVQELRALNRQLVPLGVQVLPLRCSQKQALIYAFRSTDLQRDLCNQAAAALLRRNGYQDLRVGPCVCRLVSRFRQGGAFPHEVGVFLGYPPEDVRGFIENRAGNHKCAGCWKVYGDEKAARRTFEQYKTCTRLYYTLWLHGKPISHLTVGR